MTNMTNMTNIKKWLLFVIAGAAILVLLATAASYALAYKARADAARYLRVVMPLRIGTPYNVVAAQLRNAGLHVTLPDSCSDKCRTHFSVDDKWLRTFHFARAAKFFGSLEFRDTNLVSKSTGTECETGYRALVTEAESMESGKVLGFDSSGRLLGVMVYLPASDFTESRTNAYSFNLRCVGASKACRDDEYLPRSSSISLLNVIVHSLDDENPQEEELGDRLFHLPEIQGWLQEHGCARQHYIVSPAMFSNGLPKPWGEFSMHVRDISLSAVMAEIAARSHTHDWYIEQGGARSCTVDIGWGPVQSQPKR